MPQDDKIGIGPGERLSIVGRSGSGKTYLTKWFMLHSDQHWLVLDTKYDPEYDSWRPQDGLQSPTKLKRLWDMRNVVVVRPTSEQLADKGGLDGYVGDIHDAFTDFGFNIDEAYQVCPGHHPGPGVTGLITRGRVRDQAVIVGTQRPALVPRFVFSEATHFATMSLNMKDDRKRVHEYIGHNEVLTKLPARSWFYYNVNADSLRRFGPVTIT